MRAINNQRLKEIRLAIYLNHIDKTTDKILYKKLLVILSCLALCFDGESNRILQDIISNSIGDGFLNATNKELIATAKTFFTKKSFSTRLGVTVPTVQRRYGDLYDRDFINDDFLNNLKPMYTSPKEITLISILTSFIKNFYMFHLDLDGKLGSFNRTLEIEFWLLYNNLFEIFQNDSIISKFIFNLCNTFNIDYSTIINLKNNVHVISRSYPHFTYNDQYFRQEVCTLELSKGITKYAIGSTIFRREPAYLYKKESKKFNDPIKEEDFAWQYIPTIDWKNMDKNSVIRFLELLHTFIDYGI